MTAAPPRLETRGEEERGRPRAQAVVGALAPYLAAVVVTAYVCRGPLRGRLFGDLGDARWTVSVHEHWYRVWQGLDGVRDMLYFAPLRSTLGTSDAFLLQGQVYALLRAAGLDLVGAWNVTQVVVFLVGALGVATLSSRLLRTWPARTAFVVLACASYPVVVDVGHVQLLAVLSGSWVVVGLCDVLRGRHVWRGWLLFLLGLPLLALCSWYAAVLLMVVLASIGAFTALLTPWATLRDGTTALWRRTRPLLRRPPGVAVVVLLATVGLWVATVWVYLPASALLPKPTWLETTLYAPRLSDVLNAAADGGGLWGHWYARLFPLQSYNYEQARGFTVVLFVTFVVLGLVHLRRVAVQRWSAAQEGAPGEPGADGYPGSRVLAAMWLACVAVLLVIVVDERDLSLYEPIFEHVPGMNSIRSPFRVQAFEYAAAMVVLLRTVELAAVRREGRRAATRVVALVAGVAVCLLVGAEMVRPQGLTWDADQFLRPQLRAQIPAVLASCDAVVVPAQPGGDPLMPQVDAVSLSSLTGLPTPQGYGRADPIGHPGGDAGAQALAGWMRAQGFTGRVCSVTDAGTTQVAG